MTTALRLLYIDNILDTTRKEKGLWETVCISHRPPFSTCFWGLKGWGCAPPCKVETGVRSCPTSEKGRGAAAWDEHGDLIGQPYSPKSTGEVYPSSGHVHPRREAAKWRHNDVGARQKQRVSFPLISALYIQLGEPAYSRAHSGVCRMNKMRMREGLELMIPDWSNSVW